MAERIASSLKLRQTLNNPPYYYSFADAWFHSRGGRHTAAINRIGRIGRIVCVNDVPCRNIVRKLMRECLSVKLPVRFWNKHSCWNEDEFLLSSENSRYNTRDLYAYLWWNDKLTSKSGEWSRLVFGKDLLRYASTGKVVSDVEGYIKDGSIHLYIDHKYVHLLCTVSSTSGAIRVGNPNVLDQCRIALIRYTHDEFVDTVNKTPTNVRRR